MHWTTENVNFARDARNRGAPKIPVIYDEEGNEIKLPLIWEVCPTCNGEGKHVNPAIDCNGLSREDFDEDPDFAEEYLAGRYDIDCNTCHGRTTVQVPDYDALTEEQKNQLEAEEAADDAAFQERLSEMRMGC